MNRRHCAAAAITLVCALGLLTLPAQAVAAPTPDSSPSPAASAPAAPSGQASSERDLEKIRQEIETLYRKAGAATDAYNLAEEQAKKQSGEIVKLAKAIVDGQAKIAELKDRAGAQAREQYRNGGLPPGAQLVLSDDPQLFLDGINKVRTSQQANKTVLAQLTRTQEDLETYTQDASSNWQKLESNRVRQAEAKKKINAQIAAAEKTRIAAGEEGARPAPPVGAGRREPGPVRLARHPPHAEHRRQRRGDRGRPGGGGLRERPDRQAVRLGGHGPGLVRLLGADFAGLGGGGPADPAHLAGAVAAAPRIDIQDMRPGDLIIYHADASHVGMYVGDGAIVHSPRPGRHVTLAGAGSMKILGVVRPDK